MTVLKTRSKLVTFRVSAEEHDTLTHWCVASGARSIADFAREAVLLKVEMLRAPAGTLSGDLATLSTALVDLDATLVELRRRIRVVLGPGDTNRAKAAASSHGGGTSFRD